MSLIGPRPPLTYHPWPIEEYTKEQLHMFDVRPGFSGWAQIHGRKDVEWNHRIELNVYNLIAFPFITLSGILTAYEKFFQLKLCNIINKIGTVISTIIALLLGGGLFALVWRILNMRVAILRIVTYQKKELM